jgi:L-aminopeptidase/D-esterase-like protein
MIDESVLRRPNQRDRRRVERALSGQAVSLNTTIGVVATSAALTKTEASKMAGVAHDGLARAIRPAHSMFDGDTVFALATGRRELDAAVPRAAQLARLGSAAADCLARAIARGVHEARGG